MKASWVASQAVLDKEPDHEFIEREIAGLLDVDFHTLHRRLKQC